MRFIDSLQRIYLYYSGSRVHCQYFFTIFFSLYQFGSTTRFFLYISDLQLYNLREMCKNTKDKHYFLHNDIKANHIRLAEMRLNMATNKPRYTVSVDNELFSQIEDFRFEHRYQTRSEATAELIRLGLQALKKERETSQNHNVRQ